MVSGAAVSAHAELLEDTSEAQEFMLEEDEAGEDGITAEADEEAAVEEAQDDAVTLDDIIEFDEGVEIAAEESADLAADAVTIDATNFPDPVVLAEAQKMDRNSDGSLDPDETEKWDGEVSLDYTDVSEVTGSNFLKGVGNLDVDELYVDIQCAPGTVDLSNLSATGGRYDLGITISNDIDKLILPDGQYGWVYISGSGNIGTVEVKATGAYSFELSGSGTISDIQVKGTTNFADIAFSGTVSTDAIAAKLLAQIPNQKSVTVSGNVKSLDLTANTGLEALELSGDDIEEVKGLDTCSSLKTVTVARASKLTTLDLSSAAGLQECVLFRSPQLKTVKFNSIASISAALGQDIGTYRWFTLYGYADTTSARRLAGDTPVQEIYFTGNGSDAVSENLFKDLTAKAYYPINNTTWTESNRKNYGGNITWIPWNPATGETFDSCVTAHTPGTWKVTAEATVLAEGSQTTTCTKCGAQMTESIAKLAATGKLNTGAFKMKTKQTLKKLAVNDMAKGDYVASVASSKASVVKASVSGGVITLKAGKKAGKATITVTLASGKTFTVKVTVQTKAVATSKISIGVSKKLSLKKGGKVSINAQIKPIASKDKIKYTTSNKKVAKVSKSGVITAAKKGKATITVKAGKKTVKITVTVK